MSYVAGPADSYAGAKPPWPCFPDLSRRSAQSRARETALDSCKESPQSITVSIQCTGNIFVTCRPPSVDRRGGRARGRDGCRAAFARAGNPAELRPPAIIARPVWPNFATGLQAWPRWRVALPLSCSSCSSREVPQPFGGPRSRQGAINPGMQREVGQVAGNPAQRRSPHRSSPAAPPAKQLTLYALALLRHRDKLGDERVYHMLSPFMVLVSATSPILCFFILATRSAVSSGPQALRGSGEREPRVGLIAWRWGLPFVLFH
jgi:hypothetical protein